MAKKKARESKSTQKRDRASDSPANEPHSPEPSTLSGVIGKQDPPPPVRGTGSAAAGQAGDLQGLSRDADADSQSVEELVEEGQAHEADIISAIENAPDPDEGEVRTHEFGAGRSSRKDADED
jgi:hypothetical protein